MAFCVLSYCSNIPKAIKKNKLKTPFDKTDHVIRLDDITVLSQCKAWKIRAALTGESDRSLTCAHVSERAEGEVKHKKTCTRVDSRGTEKPSLTLPLQGIKHRVFGLEFRRS